MLTCGDTLYGICNLVYFSSLSTTRVRQRLCNLMGTDVIRLNDKRYFQKLSERLQEEYEVCVSREKLNRIHEVSVTNKF